MFSFRHIKDLYPLMWSKSLELVDCIKAEMSTNGNPESGYVVEVNRWASRATLDIIGVAALGRNLNALHDTDDELVQLYEWIFYMDIKKKIWFVVHFLFPKKLIDLAPWKTNRDIMAKSVDLRRVCAKLVDEKRNEMAKESHESVDTLAHLIRSNNFSDHDLVDQLLTILAAG
jgi:cytochrome P450